MLAQSNSQPRSVTELCRYWEEKSRYHTKTTVSHRNLPISCAVKTITVEGHALIHEIELQCKCCQSTFIVRAAHECQSKEDTGLEWIQTKQGENVNLAL
jgi:hypothetical protein